MSVSCNNSKTIRPGDRCFTKWLKVGVLIVAVILMSANKASAFVVPSESAAGGIYFLGSDIAERLGEQKFELLIQQHLYLGADMNLSGYNTIVYHYPWWRDADFKEGDNIEWIYYSLENQYSFLDNALYKLSGANYLLGPVWAPRWHGFDDVYWTMDLKKQVPEIKKIKLRTRTLEPEMKDYSVRGREMYRPELSMRNLSTAYQDNIISGGNTNSEVRNSIPFIADNSRMVSQGLTSIPEPSGIILFGLVGLRILIRRREVN